MKKLIASAFSAVALLFGVAVAVDAVPGADDTSTNAAGIARPASAPGPDGIDPQHNETLLRDGS